MDDNVFWLRFWQSVIAGAVLIGITIASCTSYDTQKRVEVAKLGLSGNQINCLMSSASGYTACSYAALESKK